jgi:hypothetical protein
MVFSGKPLAVYDRHHLPTPRMKRIENARLKRRTPGSVTLDRLNLAISGSPSAFSAASTPQKWANFSG